MLVGFTPSHRGGSGAPLVCLHGFMDTWRTWELVLPALERRLVALAPAGGWAAGDESFRAMLEAQRSMHELAKTAAPHAEAIVATTEGLRRSVRVVWGTDDKLLAWPSAAARFRDEWLPHADWVELEGVGHCPQLDVPLEAAELIVGLTCG